MTQPADSTPPAASTLTSSSDPEAANPTSGLPQPPAKPREISGSAVVVGMLALGIFATSLLFIYFELHTRPFRPLREAIGREFRHSRPNVEGGRVRGRGPQILRISMSVSFNPFDNDEKSNEINQRVLQIASQHHDLTEFEQIQVNLIYFQPETTAKRRTFDWTGTDAAEKARAQLGSSQSTSPKTPVP